MPSEARERLRLAYLRGLRAHGRWEELVAEEPTDEEAHRSLMRRYADAGNRSAALRQFERVNAALAEAGLQPGAETLALHEEVARGPAVAAPVPERSPMVGRASELATARAAWRRASEGHGGVLMVSGEPGVGKTRLCEGLLAEASSSGWSTMRGAAREEEGPLPYGPIAEALDRLLAARPDLAFSLTSAAQAELARVTAASPAQPTEPKPRADRQRIFSSVAQMFARAATERGAVLLLDDLHAADEATLQLVHYLARTARYQRLLIVMAFRDRPRIPALDRMRSGLFEQRLVASEIALAPLDREASRTIAEQVSHWPLAEQTAQAIFGLARGNPFFTEELAATVDSKGAVEVPGHVYEILDGRLARLEPTLVGVLARIAIVGSEVTVDELSGLVGLEEHDAFAALDSALAAGVLEEGDGTYRFRHPLLREALERSLPDHRRLAAHRETAQRLASAGAAPARVASHLIAGDLAGEAVPWLLRAAQDAANVAAYIDALGFVERALPHSGGGDLDELLALRAELLLATGDPQAAAAYDDALAVASVDRRAALQIRQGRAHLVAGDLASASRVLDAAEAKAPVDRARRALTRGFVEWCAGDLEGVRRAAEEARPLMEAAGLGPERFEATQLEVLLAHSGDQWIGEVGLALQSTSHLPELAVSVFDAHLCVGEYVLLSGQPYDELAVFARHLRAAADSSGARRGQAFAATLLGEIELLTGQLQAAEAQLREAVELSQLAGSAGGESLALLRLAETTLECGDPAGARRLLAESLELARFSPIAFHLLYLVYEVMVRAAEEPPEAVAVVEEAEAFLDHAPACIFCPAGLYIAATTGYARAGDLARARSFLARAEGTTPLWTGGPRAAALAEARAAVLTAEGNSHEAAAALADAVAGFAQAGQVLNEARTRAALSGLP
ncbi:MAG: ATP-binding protein [Solirubrobacteraceae bacterium]